MSVLIRESQYRTRLLPFRNIPSPSYRTIDLARGQRGSDEVTAPPCHLPIPIPMDLVVAAACSFQVPRLSRYGVISEKRLSSMRCRKETPPYGDDRKKRCDANRSVIFTHPSISPLNTITTEHFSQDGTKKGMEQNALVTSSRGLISAPDAPPPTQQMPKRVPADEICHIEGRLVPCHRLCLWRSIMTRPLTIWRFRVGHCTGERGGEALAAAVDGARGRP